MNEFHPAAAGVLDLRREQRSLVINRFDDVLIPGQSLGIQRQAAAGDVQ